MADCVDELANDLQEQLAEKAKYFVAYNIAVDESMVATDTAQNVNFHAWEGFVSEELLGVKSMHGTTIGNHFSIS